MGSGGSGALVVAVGGGAGGVGRATGGWLRRHPAAPMSRTAQMQISDLKFIDFVVIIVRYRD